MTSRPSPKESAARRILGSMLALTALGAAAQLCAATSAAALTPGQEKLNGFWNIDTESRDRAGATTKAEPTEAAQAIAKRNAEAAAARRASGQILGVGTYTCAAIGIPFFVNTSEPWLLTVTDEEAVQMNERREIPARHFYLDGRPWVDVSKLPPSPNGYSIAHWEGDDLVIETRAMPPGGLPGGGMKSRDTVLTERVSLGPDDDHLTWAFTWTDPSMMARPLTYSIGYTRENEHIYAYTHDCDPNQDPAGAEAGGE